MADILLVHGASHGSWCWRDLVPALARRGHAARALDLPGNGADGRDPATVTLADYVDAVAQAIRPGDVLLGHSLAGLSTSPAAHRRRDDVVAHILLCAWVPHAGRALADYRSEGASQELLDMVVPAPDRMSNIPDPARAAEVFYDDCSREAVDYALPRLVPQPVQPMRDPCPDWQPHPNRHYIRCLRDRAIRPDYQRRATADWPEGTVHDLDVGHSPFFTCPDRLADMIDRIVRSI